MRHGEAQSHASSDFDRTLTPYGRDEVGTSVEQLMTYQLEIDLMLVSPYPRAQETAALANKTLGNLPLMTSDAVTPVASVKEALSAIKVQTEQRDSIMVVMHQPIISSLVYYLTGVQQPMRTASIAIIDAPMLERDCCTLECVI